MLAINTDFAKVTLAIYSVSS